VAVARNPWARWAKIRRSGRGLFILRYGVIGWGFPFCAVMSFVFWAQAKGHEPWIVVPCMPVCLVAGYVFGALMWRTIEDKYLAAHPEETERPTSHAEPSGHVASTEHPHVVRTEGVCGGSPTIRATRITVRHIAILWKAGESAEDIQGAFPHLQLSWIYDAISYYLDHKQDIELEIEDNQIEAVSGRTDRVLDEKAIVRFPRVKS
jgi:uncharacterized protein (DUF433 family)